MAPKAKATTSTLTACLREADTFRDVTEAEMAENRRKAGLPDNWMDLPLNFEPPEVKGREPLRKPTKPSSIFTIV